MKDSWICLLFTKHLPAEQFANSDEFVGVLLVASLENLSL